MVYSWDHRNRLVKVTFQTGQSGAATKTVDYEYDVFNQLVKRTLDADGAGTSPTAIDRTFYLYDQGQVALKFHKSGSGNVTASDLEHRYLWNPAAVDQLLADEPVTSVSAPGDTLWALTDHLGTVRDLADDSGTLRKHIYYGDTFGTIAGADYFDESGELIEGMEPWAHPDAVGVDQRFYFTGRMLDTETGLQNNLHRWYDATVGRWLSEDPIGFEGGRRQPLPLRR